MACHSKHHAHTPSYIYSSLDLCDNDVDHSNNGTSKVVIRLLDLLPGAKGDKICCSLRHTLLYKGIPYEALSYTWGSPNRIHQIMYDDTVIKVTSTLREVLLGLRDLKETRTLWVDQLCIHQEDIQERNSQVKIMHLIYKNATRSIIFLTTGELPELRMKLNTANLVSDIRKAHKCGEGEVLKEWQQMFSHSWFQRVWILQEIGMSNVAKITVYYRGTRKSWAQLASASVLLDSYSAGPRWELLQFQPSVRRHQMYMSRWTNMGMVTSQFPSLDRCGHLSSKFNKWAYSRLFLSIEPRLTELLQDSRFSLATDSRDKIFSLLNMLRFGTMDDKYSYLLDVDYSLPAAEVYTRAARYSVETDLSIEVLCYKEGRPDIPNLPSWVPDWTQQRLFPIHRVAYPHHYRSQFHQDIWPMKAGLPPLRRTSNRNPVASFSAGDTAITLVGYRLDTIAMVSNIWEASLDSPDDALFHEWATIYTGGKASEIADLPLKPEHIPTGIRTARRSICDFWLRVSRHTRLRASDTPSPLHSDQHLEREWEQSPYFRSRRVRMMILYRGGLLSALLYNSWLAMMLPYASVGRRVAATRNGYFSLVPPETRAGDVVFFLKGGGTLGFVLRGLDNANGFELVGVAYVHGFYGTRKSCNCSDPESICIK